MDLKAMDLSEFFRQKNRKIWNIVQTTIASFREKKKKKNTRRLH